MKAGNEIKTFWVYMTNADLPQQAAHLMVRNIDYSQVPALFDAINDGFTPISHSMLDRDHGVLVSILLIKPIDVPDSPTAIAAMPDLHTRPENPGDVDEP